MLSLHWTIRAGLTTALALCLCGCSGSGSSGPEEPGGFVEAQPEPEPETPDPVVPPQVKDVAFLSPVDHLVRASMALRGVRPSVEDMEAVRDDPDKLPGLVDAYLDSPAFGETIREMYDEVWLLRAFLFMFAPRGEYEGMDMVEFDNSVGESPLRLIEHVVMNDRPFTEIVTADYAVANEYVATVWGMDYDGDGQEWIETRYPEPGRPHAGILSDSKLFIRHYSAPLNAQRGRANAISKGLLCFDFLARDIDVSGNVDLSDPEAVKNAVKSPACASCHQTLDPLGGFFWSYEYFVFPSDTQQYPMSTWRPEYEQHRPFFSGREPGYFGLEADDLQDLGARIAADPRFAQCAARRFYGYFAQVDPKEVPFDLVAHLQGAFVDSGMSAKALARAAVLSDAFRASHGESEAAAADLVGLKKLRPRDASRMMADLTGFTWQTRVDFSIFAERGVTSPYGTIDLMKDTLLGYEVLMGGLDDFVVNQPVHTFNPTMSLVMQAFATEAAGFVVDRDLDAIGPIRAKLLTEVDEEERDEADLRAQLAQLHLRLFGEFVEPDGAEVDLSYELFDAALKLSDDPRRAWKTTLTAMLQDSRLLYY